MTKRFLEQFPDNGYADFGGILDPSKCVQLRSLVNKEHPLNKNIFYETPEQFDKEGRWHHYAPGRDSHNYLLNNESKLAFIEEEETFVEIEYYLEVK